MDLDASVPKSLILGQSANDDLRFAVELFAHKPSVPFKTFLRVSMLSVVVYSMFLNGFIFKVRNDYFPLTLSQPSV